ncbi:50S ribosomal protein L10 [Mycoplasmopsis caviae]|uniref:Large ribosomal subunit protein uL10 n=1 Tax=Mycoplasmopsis caviae TaxID=55603 RepID=A0A3P8MDE2_9BACT|nr:50S ribosomal protein L10 [Mycoplasmopsis caviae]UUD35557.1 50S ribosomal protein L10 [Mycoplasmopsis caviae]VDR41670.1 50s ribosomal protein L10 [Mycoplasmopsis caviae]VDR42587.1 50s ribosomal protein L10 [Mycoplasmopsis caviae]
MQKTHESAFRLAKMDTVKEIQSKLESSQALVIAEYRGLSVAELTALRQLAKKEGIDIKVYKNRLFKIAAKNQGINDLEQHLVGPNIFAFGTADALVATKVLVKFAKENKLLVPKAGIFEGKVIDAKGVAEVASLPNYEEALTILARSLMAPLQQLSLSLKLFSEKEENK